MISVLLPTRGRCSLLPDSLGRLLDIAVEPSEVEVILRVDEDDDQCQAYLDNAGRYRAKVIVGPRLGYKRMHEYWKELADAAAGDWLLNWNDDAIMLTPGWDVALRSGPPLTVQFIRRNTLEGGIDTTFPVMSRALYQAVGRMADNCHTDDWLGRVSKAAGAYVERPDVVFRHDQLTGLTDEDMVRFDSPSGRAERAVDVAKMIACRRAAGLV